MRARLSGSAAKALRRGGGRGQVSLYDNVTLQHRLVTEHFGITKVKLVLFLPLPSHHPDPLPSRSRSLPSASRSASLSLMHSLP